MSVDNGITSMGETLTPIQGSTQTANLAASCTLSNTPKVCWTALTAPQDATSNTQSRFHATCTLSGQIHTPPSFLGPTLQLLPTGTATGVVILMPHMHYYGGNRSAVQPVVHSQHWLILYSSLRQTGQHPPQKHRDPTPETATMDVHCKCGVHYCCAPYPPTVCQTLWHVTSDPCSL
jgi:hypothetical protein